MIGDDWKGMKEKVTGMPALKKKKKITEKIKIWYVLLKTFYDSFLFFRINKQLNTQNTQKYFHPCVTSQSKSKKCPLKGGSKRELCFMEHACHHL